MKVLDYIKFVYSVGFKTDRKLATSTNKYQSVAASWDIFLANIWQKLLFRCLFQFYFSWLSVCNFCLKTSCLGVSGIRINHLKIYLFFFFGKGSDTNSPNIKPDLYLHSLKSIFTKATSETGSPSSYETPSAAYTLQFFEICRSTTGGFKRKCASAVRHLILFLLLGRSHWYNDWGGILIFKSTAEFRDRVRVLESVTANYLSP